jgi:DnaJ-class molecular chaperone
MDPYAMLGVGRKATTPQIRSAYRRKAAKAHPDHGGSPEDFRRLKQAESVLIDPEARAHYDRTGEIIEKSPASTLDQQATGIIAGMLYGLIDDVNADIFKADVIAIMVAHLQKGIAANQANVTGFERKIERAERMRGRFRKKKADPEAGPNLVEMMLAARIPEYQRAIEAAKNAATVGERAVEILSDYSFEADVQQLIVQSFGNIFSATTSTRTW